MSTTTTLNSKQYPVCKDSRVTWIGHIPDHWEVGNLRYFTRPLDGARIPLSAEQRGTMQGTIPYWGANSVIDHVNDWIFNEPLVLVGEDGAPFQDPYREVAFFVDEKVWVNNHIHVIRCGNRLNSKFFTYVLNTVDYTNFISGSTRDKLTQQDLGNIPIQVPPISEQDAIGRYLDDADQLIRAYVSAKERLIALLEEMRQAVIHQAVTRGLDPNVKLKPSGVEWLGDVPEHWVTCRIKQVSGILRGKFTHRPRNDPSLYDGPYPFIQTGDIASTNKILSGYNQTLNENGFAVSKMFPKGTLVMTIAANIGDVAVLDFDACFPDSVVGFVPTVRVDRDYLYYLFLAMKNELLREAPVNTQGNLNVDRIGSSTIALPQKEEQTNIVNHVERSVSNIDAAIDLARRQIELMEEYRTRLIADVVTGKIDVREAANT